MNYYERHVGDYLKDTAHLSLLEHGVYTRLLDVYYTRETPFASGEAARLVGARTKDERAAVESVLAEFFKGGRQTRCDREIERYQVKAEHNRRVGKLGGRPPKQKPTGFPLGSETEPTTNPSRTLPVTSNQKPEEKEISNPSGSPSSALPKVAKFPPGFDAFWSVYPRKVGKDAAAKAYAKRRFATEQQGVVIDALRSQLPALALLEPRFVPHPATWLGEGRWQDESAVVDDRFSGAI